MPDGAGYQQRLRALGELMMPQTDRRLLEEWGEEGRDTRSAAEYRAELREEVAGLGGLDRVVRAGSRPDVQVEVRDLGGPAPQHAGELGRRPSPRQLNVLHELAQALDGDELGYLSRFFGGTFEVARAVGVSERDVREWRRGRPGDRAVVRGRSVKRRATNSIPSWRRNSQACWIGLSVWAERRCRPRAQRAPRGLLWTAMLSPLVTMVRVVVRLGLGRRHHSGWAGAGGVAGWPVAASGGVA